MIVQTLNEKIQVYLECTLNSCPFSFPLSFATFILIIKICALDKKDQTFVDAYNMLATVLGWNT